LTLLKRGRKLVFLSLTNVDPKALTQLFLIYVIVKTYNGMQWITLRMNDEYTTSQRRVNQHRMEETESLETPLEVILLGSVKTRNVSR
jgi:hypothetical protein